MPRDTVSNHLVRIPLIGQHKSLECFKTSIVGPNYGHHADGPFFSDAILGDAAARVCSSSVVTVMAFW